MMDISRAVIEESSLLTTQAAQAAVEIYNRGKIIAPRLNSSDFDRIAEVDRLKKLAETVGWYLQQLSDCYHPGFDDAIKHGNAATLTPMALHAVHRDAGEFRTTYHELLWLFAMGAFEHVRDVLISDNALSQMRGLRRLAHWSSSILINVSKAIPNLEGERFRAIAWLEGDTTTSQMTQNGVRTADDSAVTSKIKSPQSQNVNEFIQYLKRKKPSKGQETAAAREFCEKHGLPLTKARGLIRGARRYPNLW